MSDLFARIVVAVDDSEPSERALALAIDLATKHHSILTCVHAIDWVGPVSQLESGGMGAIDPTMLVDELRKDGQALMDRAQASAKAAGITCEAALIEDKPVAAVISAAQKAAADIIILGTHGRKGMGRLVLGSVAEGVLHASKIPVLVVPVRPA